MRPCLSILVYHFLSQFSANCLAHSKYSINTWEVSHWVSIFKLRASFKKKMLYGEKKMAINNIVKEISILCFWMIEKMMVTSIGINNGPITLQWTGLHSWFDLVAHGEVILMIPRLQLKLLCDVLRWEHMEEVLI